MTPTPGLDPRIALATSLQAAPGIYAVLVGSGMSTAARIPTGWQVVQDLARKVAAAEGVDLGVQAPEAWFAGRFGHEPRYDELLADLASTDPARQALLRDYFDPPASAGGPIGPTDGHRALAQLCAAGRIRVILTTNFDRLIERALADAGVPAQVLWTAESLRGMTPLVHAPATVIKLHGDYMSKMRNAPDELASYPDELRRVLDRVLDEYGLIVVGWSAEYDTALRAAIEACPSRRYPTYWISHRGHLTEAAQRLVAQRSAAVVASNGGDEFFADLVERVTRLDRRALRRGRPAVLRHYNFAPQGSRPADGWEFVPLLQLRAAAAIGPATIENCGVIGPGERQALVSALVSAPVTLAIAGLSRAPGARATPTHETTDAGKAQAFSSWEPTPDGYQSDMHASYRLGGDGTFGVSALLTIQLPSPGVGGSVVFTFDLGVSIEASIWIGQAAMLWRDAVVLTSTLLPDALGTVLPPEADVYQIELHVLAATDDGQGNSRPTDLTERLDMQNFGIPTRPVGPAMGVAMRVDGGLAGQEAGMLVSEAINHMALANGYLDPRIGLSMVRASLGLPATSSTESS